MGRDGGSDDSEPRLDIARAGLVIACASALSTTLGVLASSAAGSPPRALGLLAWLTLASIYWLMCTGIAVLGSPVVLLAKKRPTLAAVLASLLLVGPGYAMGSALASGEWISQQGYAWAVRWGPGLACAAAFAGLLRLLWHVPPGAARSRLARVLTASLFLGALASALADAFVMPGLHRAFHLYMGFTAGLLATLGFARLFAARPRKAIPTLPAAASIVAVTLGSLAALVLMTPAVRAQLLMNSPPASHLLRALGTGGSGKALARIYDDTETRQLLEQVPLPRGLMKTGPDWNVVLVIVDTLRADVLPPGRDGTRAFHEKIETPFLDDWIARSFRFDRAYAQASATHFSIPPLMRSVESYEDPRRVGRSLPEYMNELGRRPFAVVNQFFVEPHIERLTDLTSDFDRLAVYDEFDMNQLVPLFEDQLDEVEGQPFFAWVHFYNMHAPGWNGRRLGPKDGNLATRYALSANWLDAQMRLIVGALEERGLGENTIIILASDHGESLGQHGQKKHGPSTFEEVIHVPLVIHVPGVRGGEIDEVVSNVDILPTIADLLGAPSEPSHRGLSLVPLMTGVVDDTERAVYATNWDGTWAAVVQGTQKLIWDADAEVFLRFDLERDPNETTSSYTGESAVDRALARRLLLLNPQIFAKELSEPAARDEVERGLAAIDPIHPTTELVHLLRMAAVDPTDTMLDEAQRIFEGAKHERVHALVLRELYASDEKRWGPRLEARIDAIAGTPAELDLIRELAQAGVPAIAPEKIAARMEHWAHEGTPSSWMPWLALIRSWAPRSLSHFHPPLRVMLERASEDPSTEAGILTALLRACANLDRDPDPALAALAIGFTAHQDPRVRTFATRASGKVGSETDLATLDAIREDADVRLRVAALEAAIDIAPDEAEARILQHKDDPMMVWSVTRKLETYGGPDSLDFLRHTRETHADHWTRTWAKRAISAIEKRNRRPKSDPPPK